MDVDVRAIEPRLLSSRSSHVGNGASRGREGANSPSSTNSLKKAAS